VVALWSLDTPLIPTKEASIIVHTLYIRYVQAGENFRMERLQKLLAQAGVASRRKCEELISSGRVMVDGVVVTELGTKVNAQLQHIMVDGKPIQMEHKVCLILNKPTSRITSVSDPQGRRTVMDLVAGVPERVYPVGRLDYDTSGLLLMSNDGELTQRLLHPSHETEKVYRVTLVGMLERETIAQIRSGIELEDGKTAPAGLFVLRQHPKESVADLTIHEGRNRQVRRMFEAVDLPVKRLKRIQFGPLQLGPLPTGEWRMLTKEELRLLYQSVGLHPPEDAVKTTEVSGKTVKPNPRSRSSRDHVTSTRPSGAKPRTMPHGSDTGSQRVSNRPKKPTGSESTFVGNHRDPKGNARNRSGSPMQTTSKGRPKSSFKR
jgi:23S rRNA pseudouridine2605 synthase